MQHGLPAALNLSADAAIWFRAQTVDLNSLSWDLLKLALQWAFRPIDYIRNY